LNFRWVDAHGQRQAFDAVEDQTGCPRLALQSRAPDRACQEPLVLHRPRCRPLELLTHCSKAIRQRRAALRSATGVATYSLDPFRHLCLQMLRTRPRQRRGIRALVARGAPEGPGWYGGRTPHPGAHRRGITAWAARGAKQARQIQGRMRRLHRRAALRAGPCDVPGSQAASRPGCQRLWLLPLPHNQSLLCHRRRWRFRLASHSWPDFL